MASTCCIDCEREVGDNWPECYWCGGKKFKVGGQESSSVSSILEESEEDLLPDPEDINFEDVEISVERVRQLLSKDNLNESELDELSMGFIYYDELSEADKEKIKMLFDNLPVFSTSEKIFANTIMGVLCLFILVLAVILFTKFGF